MLTAKLVTMFATTFTTTFVVAGLLGAAMTSRAAEIPVIHEVDVVVVGGTAAAVAAAEAAARAGANVFLAARRSYLGDDVAGTLLDLVLEEKRASPKAPSVPRAELTPLNAKKFLDQALIDADAASGADSFPLPRAELEAAVGVEIAAAGMKNGTIPLQIRQRLKVDVQPRAAGGKTYRYESGNAGFFTVDAEGNLLGVHEGRSMLSVMLDGEIVKTAVVEVLGEAEPLQAGVPSGGQPSTGILIANEGGTVEVGTVERIIAHVLPYHVIGSNPFTLGTSDPSVMAVLDEAKIVEAVRPGRATITVSTLDGRHRASVDYQVVPKAAPAPVKTLDLEPARFGIVYDVATEAVAKGNSAAIQCALLFASTNGFGRVLMEKGKTLTIEPKDTIRMISNVQLDLNGSEILLRPNAHTNYIAFLFAERPEAGRVLENASIVNGTITGERDRKAEFFQKWASTPHTEGSMTIEFDEGRNNGISNLVVRKSVGFNIGSGLGSKASGVQRFTHRTIGIGNLEPGGFDRDGMPVSSVAQIRTVKPLDVAGLTTPYYVVGLPLGYMGYPHMNSRIYDVWYFDTDMRLVASAQGLLRYRRYALPEGAAFVHFAFYNAAVPQTGTADFHGAVAFVENRAFPTHNYMIDCVIEDNFSTGFAACGGQRWLIKGNVFRRNGGRMPGSDIDWEDGWEYMQGDLVEDNVFESRMNVITCAGIGLVFRNNVFRGESLFYGRSQHYSLVGNTFDAAGGAFRSKVTISSQTDVHTHGNRFVNSSVSFSRQHASMADANYVARLSSDVFENTHVSGGTAGPQFRRCTFSAGTNIVQLAGVSLSECAIGAGRYDASGLIEQTRIENASFRVLKEGRLAFRNCQLLNPSFTASNACEGVLLDAVTISMEKPSTLVSPNNMTFFTIRNADMKFSPAASPFILSGGWNASGAETVVTLEKVRFSLPLAFEGHLHKFTWYPAAAEPRKIAYDIIGTDVSGVRMTDEKGKAGTAVFNLKP